MDIGINDLDFGEEEKTPEQLEQEKQLYGASLDQEKPLINNQAITENGNIQSPTDQGIKDDIISELLTAKGIKNPNAINFEKEDGTPYTRGWKDLSKEEKINILNTPQDVENNDLDDSEIELINQLRLTDMTPEEFIQKTKQDALNEYAQQVTTQEPSYLIDNISDEDLYVYDLKARTPDITDEELAVALSKAQEDPELFTKQMSGIRTEYKQLEEDDKAQKQAIEDQAQQEQLAQFQDSVGQAVMNLDSIGSLDVSLSDDDKQELAEFILGSDQAGVSYLGQALNDPDTLTRMAWFALKGPDALDEIQDYFSQQIGTVRQQAYQQGLKDAAKQQHVVITNPNGKEETPKPGFVSQFASNNITDINQLD